MSPREEALERYQELTRKAEARGELAELYRSLCLQDLFFLLIYVLKCGFANNDWAFARCREFEADSSGYIDLWPREHLKSTIITLAAVIQRILRDPEVTVGIFSFNRPAAKVFLRAIKTHFEMNELLKNLFSDILWTDPQKEASKWSEDDGIIVKRKSIRREMTVEASGVVDGMPTGKHYGILVYDDLVTRDSVTTPEMIQKVTEAVSISFNLGSEGGERWFVGTRYHYADTYSELIRREAVKLRLYAATVDGSFDGEPVLWSRETLKEKIKSMGVYVASCQLFNKPIMEGEETFSEDWIEWWTPKRLNRMNVYITVDAASSKKLGSDYTVMVVWGLGADKNYYVIDMVHDKLDLGERARRLFKLHAEYKPILVGYERYGMQGDIEYIKEKMSTEQYRFRIVELGGAMPKNDRIKRLQPLFQDHRIYIPEKLIRTSVKEKRAYDLTQVFLQDEYLQFPYMTHDDILDCMSRICDEKMGATFPKPGKETESGLPAYADDEDERSYDFNTYDYLTERR